MRLNLLNNCPVHSYYPLRIGERDAEAGPRLGGISPKGVMPAFVNSRTRYFGTLPLNQEGSLEVSIFTSFDYSGSGPLSIASNMCKILSETSALVQFVVHNPSRRANFGGLTSEYSGQCLCVGPLEEEKPDDIYIGHKMGGEPFYYHSTQEVLGDADRVRSLGYIYFLQFAFPNPHDGGKGDWPFGNYMFHVFAKEIRGCVAFQYMLE